MRSCDRRAGVAIATLLLAGLAAPASAQPQADKQRAEAKLAEVRHRFDRGDRQGALATLEEAWALYPSPKLHFNFAVLYRSLGRDAEAVQSYERYLDEVKQPERAREATAAMAELLPRIGRVQIRCDTAGAEIRIGGMARGRTPHAAFAVAPGSHDVLVRHDDLPTVYRYIVTVRAGELLGLEVQLHSPAATAATSSGQPALPLVAATERATNASPSSPARVAAWATAGGAAAGLAFGAVNHWLWARRSRRFDEYTGMNPADGNAIDRVCGEVEPNHGLPGCDALYQDYTASRRWTLVGYGAGAALGLGSAVLFWYSARAGDSGARALTTCAPALAGRGVGCILRF